MHYQTYEGRQHLSLLEVNVLFKVAHVHCISIRARPEARKVPCGPAQDVLEVGRNVRNLMERVRAQLSDLPHHLPARLLIWLL